MGDSVRFNLGFGAGLYVEAEATSLVHPSVGFADVSLRPRYALEWEPRPVPPGRLRTAAFPTQLLTWPFHGYTEVKEGYGDTHPYLRGFFAPFALVGSQHVAKETTGLLGLGHWLGNPRFAEERAWEAEQLAASDRPDGSDAEDSSAPSPRLNAPLRGAGFVRHGWLGVSGTAAVVQFDLGINPVECVDFLTGLVGWDLLEDDPLER